MLQTSLVNGKRSRNQINSLQRLQIATPHADILNIQPRVELTSTSTSTSSTSSLANSSSNQVECMRTNQNFLVDTPNEVRACSPEKTFNGLRNFDGYSETTLLTDIDPDHYGIFTGVSPSLTFIPENKVRQIRLIFIRFMQRCIDDPSSLNWKKFLLLSLVLFDNDPKNTLNQRKKTMAERIALLLKDDWSTFTLGSLSKKIINTENITPEQIHKAAMRLAESGEIGKAFKKLKADPRKIVPNIEILEKLQSKHPEPSPTDLTREQIQAIFEYSPDNDNDIEKIIATESDIQRILWKARSHVAHGIDHTRYEHLKQLFSVSTNDPNVKEFRKLLTMIINKIIQAQVPDSFATVFKDIELLALPKADDDIRPIGLQFIFRKIAGSVCLKRTHAFNASHFKELQYCLQPAGAESINLSFRAILERFPELDIWAKDAENAFNRSSRLEALHEVRVNFRQLLPLLRMTYGTSSNAWYMGLPEGIDSIKSQEGSQQGDVLAMWLYAMAIHKFLQKIRDTLGSSGFTKWFADDGNTAATFEKMLEVIQVVKTEGPKVGYHIKFSKGTYLLGKCDTREEAESRKRQLIQQGFHEETVVLHPANAPETSHLYGCKMVGSWIGTDEYIKSQLQAKLQKLKTEADVIKAFPDPQVQNLMLRWCYAQKVNYLQRSIPPDLLIEFLDGFNALKRDILDSILQTKIDDSTWMQSCLAISDGGLGLQIVQNVSHAAYIASVFECATDLKRVCPDIFETDIPMIRAFNNALAQNAHLEGREIPMTYQDVQALHSNQNQNAKPQRDTLQNKLYELQRPRIVEQFLNSVTDTKRLGWITSLSGDSKSGRWLEVSPKTNDYKFTGEEFRTQLHHRLFLQQPSYTHDSKCTCKNTPRLDPLGHHIASGCSKDGTLHKAHDTIKYIFKDMCNYAGLMTRLEEQRCFQTAFADNNQRPDLSIFNFPKSKKKVIIDIALAHPVPILGNKVLSRNQAEQPYRAANAKFAAKERKYFNVADANNLEFLPIIFETTGKMHPKTTTFFDTVTSHMARGDASIKAKSVLFWSARISCAIQKSIANAILSRSQIINGNLTREMNYQFALDFVANFPVARN